jgi:prophage tail gpP-like protein
MVYVPNKERANLIVGGEQFADWTSIWVQRTWGNAYDQFKFSCAERDGATPGQVSSSSKFKPGDECTITLAGQHAISGYIITRQCAYDANSHAVQLQGTNRTWRPATSGIEHKTNRFDGKTFLAIAREVLGKAKAQFEVQGSIPETPFRYCHTEKGETIFDFLKRLAGNINVIVSCTKEGNFLFVGDGPGSSSQGQLIEGENILKMQAIITQERKFGKYIIHAGSNARDDFKFQKPAELMDEDEPDDKFYRVKLMTMEEPTDKRDTVTKRMKAEQMWDRGTEMNVTVVVYGWQPDGSGALWEPGSDVYVKSPMALIDQKLSIQSVTYTQDNNSGSLTTLVCVGPDALKKGKY